MAASLKLCSDMTLLPHVQNRFPFTIWRLSSASPQQWRLFASPSKRLLAQGPAVGVGFPAAASPAAFAGFFVEAFALARVES
jgi:hypothetical protein